MNELFQLERQGWQALSTAGDAGRNFYADLPHDDAVMLFPGGLRIEGRERILESLGMQPWRTFELTDLRSIPLSPEVTTLIYRVTAQREGSEPYSALVSSTYVRQRDWTLVVHQQTPV